MKFTTTALAAVAIGALAVSAAPQPFKRSGSGKATWYRQEGTTGSCGKTHSDEDKVVAVPSFMAGKHCGDKITIHHGGKSIIATIADTCPGCDGNQLDLSRGAFNALASYDQGEIDISWSYN